MEDFEKGLMLSGLVSPNSITELNERLELEEYEKELKKENKTIFFKRVVLAAEVAYQLHNEPTFGSVKFQKLVYLCEHAANMRLQERYRKQVAGPFDNRFMHSINKEFKNNKWFEIEKVISGTIKRSRYKPLSSVEKYKTYYKSYFAQYEAAIQEIINLFRTRITDDTEIAATLFSCQLELQKNSENVTESNLLEKFYNWSEKKKRFDSAKVLSIWHWMTEKQLLPSKEISK
jgi:hypothetical protein